MPDPSLLASYENADSLQPLATEDVSAEEREKKLRFHLTAFESCWHVAFHAIDDPLMLPRPMGISVQIVRNARYNHPCRFSQNVDYRYFCYTLSGVGGVWDASGTYPVPPGQAFLVEKDNADAGYFYPEGGREPWRFIGFTFNGLSAQAMTRSLLQRYGPVYALPLETPIIARLLGFECVGQRITSIPLAEGAQLVTELLLALLTAAETREENAPGSGMIRRAIALLSGDEDLSVQDVANDLGVSREHLSRSFQKRFGMSPRQFCLKQRMHKACILLKSTDLPIKAIAKYLGYTEYSNFAVAFRQVTQMSPGEFRQRGVPTVSFPFWSDVAGLTSKFRGFVE